MEQADRLNAQANLLAEVSIAYKDLRAQLTGGEVTEDSLDIRYAHLKADTLGHRVEVDVEVPPAPDTARGSILLQRDVEKVWLSLLETPEGEKLLEAEASARIDVTLDSIYARTERPSSLFSLDVFGKKEFVVGAGIGALLTLGILSIAN